MTDKGVIAVQSFDLDIADKEFIVLVGPSGCGKSTTPRMNFFDAKLLKEGGKYSVSVSGVTVALPESKQKALAEKNAVSQNITLGVRPSHITLGEGENTISAKVDVSEMMGSEVHLHVNAEGRDVVVIVPTLDLSSVKFAPGTEIRLHFDGNVCHLFDNQGKHLEF